MGAQQIEEDLEYQLLINRPNIVALRSFNQIHKEPVEKILSIMDSVCAKSVAEAEPEEKINKVFCLKGRVLNSQLNIKVKVIRLLNERDLQKGKADLESVVDCSLYGLYKGTVANPALLQLAKLDKGGKCCPRISLPVDYCPDGNCKNDGSNRPRTQTKIQEAINTHSSSEATTSKRAPQTEVPSVGKASTSTTSMKSSSNSTHRPKAKAQNKQPKLFFNQSSSATKKSSTESHSDRVTSEETEMTKSVKKEPETVVDKNDSPGKSSDKENTSNRKESKPKRTRVQMFSSSESDSEPEPTVQQKKKSRPSNSTADPEVKQRNGKDKSLINRTGLVLDPEDMQNESEEDERVDDTTKPKRSLDVKTEGKTKRRRKNKNKEEEVGNSSSEEQTSSKQKHNFGSVKAGERCSSVKYVDKTFVDAEGFLVTEKVLEEVKSDAPPPPTDNKPRSKDLVASKKAEPSKKPKPLPKQQSSLFKFFKAK